MKENLLDLIGYHDKWHSQVQKNRKPYIYNQNEHLIEEILQRLEIESGVCVEFGAWDGIYNSNTKNLIDKNWSAVLIEPDITRFSQLKNNFKHNKKVITLNNFIDFDGNKFDYIVKQQNIKEIDFCSIDIDGLDLEIFETFETYLPKLICIEGGQMLHPHAERVPKEVAQHNIQQSLQIMTDSFEKKGYKLLCSYQDTFYIKEEFFHLFPVETSLINHYIEGLITLPRIPWIKMILDKYNIHNEIIEESIKDIPPTIMRMMSSPGIPKEEKMRWVDFYYSRIKERLLNLKENDDD
jgi:hypothetical protein